jgi:hypothetical protein
VQRILALHDALPALNGVDLTCYLMLVVGFSPIFAILVFILTGTPGIDKIVNKRGILCTQFLMSCSKS